MKITPMLEQYLRAKQEHPDALLFFRMGDFYEMFFEDAERGSRLLDIALTTRSKKDEVPIPMCGVPHFSLQNHIGKLLSLGVKVAVCEQMEDPALARGLVTREVVRVITAGTVTEDCYLDPKQPNYLAAVASEGEEYGLVYVELSTGEVRRSRPANATELRELLARTPPREVIVAEEGGGAVEVVRAAVPDAAISPVPAAQFDGEAGALWLRERQPEAEFDALVCAALGAVLGYLRQTHRASLDHLRAPEQDEIGGRMHLDEATRRNLELLTTSRGERRGSLLWVLDETQTPMGGRLLRQWLLEPLTDPAAIGARLDAVEELVGEPARRKALRKTLSAVGDLERLIARIGAARVTPRDVLGLVASLDSVEKIRGEIGSLRAPSIGEAVARLDDLPGLRQRIRSTLVDDPPLTANAGKLIRAGFDARIDELRTLAHHGKETIGALEAAERQRTGIQSLKIRYTQAFGYYIEVTRANLERVPADYRRKQTLVNAERFVTPQLEEYEAKVLGAEEKLVALEAQLFRELVAEAALHHRALGRTAVALARLDVFAALAEVAERNRYCRPSFHSGRRIAIQDGRHPVVELVAGRQGFVPNDTLLDPENEQILVVTGPNMAGKSTYLRQVALISLLAQIGSFVPAASADLGIVDRLFTRIGASDNLAGGESTFMVEMKETAGILSQLTDRSLVVLDEIGRGTSTFDGISIAWAVAEHVHDSPRRPLVLFATHYHELTDLARTRERVRNFSVAVREWKGEVLFLRRVVPGPASQSYGIQVAQLAGVPPPVIARAKEILANLEKGELTEAGQPRLAQGARRNGAQQLALFAAPDERLRSEIAAIDVERLTPVEALNRLHDLVARARGS